MIQEKQKISGTLNSKQSLNGSLSNSVIYVDPITQEKTVIPTTDQQIVTPDENYTGLSKVTVEAIQDENLISENIKNGVDILGVTGNYVGSKYAPRDVSFYAYTGTELDYEIANLDTSNITIMAYMFHNNANLQSLDLSNFNTSKVTSMMQMFLGCRNITTLDLSSFNTSNVTDMSSMFYDCQKLTALDISNFNTSKVKNMSYMFNDCFKLTTLDLTNFDTSNVTTFYQMFYRCNKIVSIPKLNAIKVTSLNYFVYNCIALTDFGGLENLGQAYSTTQSANYYNYKLDLSTCTTLTEQSLINVLTNLYDIKTKGCKAQQVILGSTNLAKLVSEEGQAALSNAQAKGWTVS